MSPENAIQDRYDAAHAAMSTPIDALTAAVGIKVNETFQEFRKHPTYLYLGRFESALIENQRHVRPIVTMERRRFTGLLVFIVDAPRHLEVGFGPA